MIQFNIYLSTNNSVIRNESTFLFISYFPGVFERENHLEVRNPFGLNYQLKKMSLHIQSGFL